MPRKTLSALCILLALGTSVTVRTARAQEGAFLREFNLSELDEAKSVAVDDTGVYVAGGGNNGAFLRKYDLSGNEQWTRTFGAPDYTATGIAVNTGSVYVLGYIGLDPDSSFIRKYDTEGNELWFRQIHSDAIGMAADAGGVYVAGGRNDNGFLRKYDLSGNEMWNRSLSVGWVSAVAADDTGAYVVGGIFSGAAGGFLQKRSNAGEELWTHEFPGRPFAVAVQATDIYVASLKDWQWSLVKYDPNGNELRSSHFDLAHSFDSIQAKGVAVDMSGVYMVGTTRLTLANSCRAALQDIFAHKYSLDGESLWTHQLSGSLDYTYGNAVAVNDTGVYIAGVTIGCGPHGCGVRALLARVEKAQLVASASGPWITPGCVVNAANYVGGRVSPGEIVTIAGRRIGPAEPALLSLTEGGRLVTTLAGTRVLFNGIAAPLLYVSESQINAIVPYALAHSPTVDVEVEYQGVRSNMVTMPVTPSRPGLFTLDGSGSGHVAALNQDGSINSVSNPAERGSVIVLYATGEGLTSPLVPDGSILSLAPPKPSLPVSVRFCCYSDQVWDGQVLYAGGVSGSVAGLLQVNVRVPANLYLDPIAPGPQGEASVEIYIDGQTSGFDTFVFIRGVNDVPGPNDACGGCWDY